MGVGSKGSRAAGTSPESWGGPRTVGRIDSETAFTTKEPLVWGTNMGIWALPSEGCCQGTSNQQRLRQKPGKPQSSSLFVPGAIHPIWGLSGWHTKPASHSQTHLCAACDYLSDTAIGPCGSGAGCDRVFSGLIYLRR